MLVTRGSRRPNLATGETVRSRSQTHLHVCGFMHEATGKPEDPGTSYRVDWVSKAGYWKDLYCVYRLPTN